MIRSAGCGLHEVAGTPVASLEELVRIDAPEFSLELTLGCGQVFHWVRAGNGYTGTIGDLPIYVEQQGESLLVPRGSEAKAREYFALDHPMPEICESFPGDEAMQKAAGFCRGLRLIRQPLWECVATFITSSMKQVAHIAQISHTLRRRFGSRQEVLGMEMYAYPTAEALAALAEEDLRACSLGYRAKNLIGAARMVASGEVDLNAICGMPDEAALKELCRLPGVGEKVANCALLFAFERVRAFPIDVWIERVLREIYFPGKHRVTAGRLRDFCGTYFGPYGGYAQQYLFHYARVHWPRQRKAPAGRGRRNRLPKRTVTP
jgi:N-glycosylase/DNA lyase